MQDWSDKPLDDREFPDDEDLEDGDEEEQILASLMPCPNCRRMIHEEAPQCPHCREWILGDTRDWRQSPKWYIRWGLYLTQVLLLNWLFWLAMGAVGAIVWVVSTGR